MPIFDPDEPLASAFTQAVSEALDVFFDTQEGRSQLDLVALARAFTAGGKRLRPAFCAWGYLAVTPEPNDPAWLVRVAASLDLLHVSALVHDDVMDGSATRRGLPAAHVQLAAWHRANNMRGDPEAFGRAGAIVLGNLLAAWSAELYDTAGAPEETLRRGRPVLAGMRTEVNTGQFLDALAQARSPLDARRDPAAMLALTHQVIDYKTTKYTIVRPLQLGAALAGANRRTLEGLAAFGSPLGRAFQLRDDLLGVFGDEAVTGKPAGDDLREGKLTALVVHAMENTSDASAARLAALLGDPTLTPADIDEARAIIATSGAQTAVEADIEAARAEALNTLASLPIRPEAGRALTALTHLATARSS